MLTLTLVDSQQPVTISKDNYNIFSPTNAFTITEVPSGRVIDTVFINVCMRGRPPLRLDSEHVGRFFTFEPSIPC